MPSNDVFATDIPIWGACPYRDKVGPLLEVRRGFAYGVDTVVFRNPVTERHIAMIAVGVREVEDFLPVVHRKLLPLRDGERHEEEDDGAKAADDAGDAAEQERDGYKPTGEGAADADAARAAAAPAEHQTQERRPVIWACGCAHWTRGEAIDCLRRQAGAS